MKTSGNRQPVEQALENYETAPVTPKMRAALGFLRKLTLSPQTVIKADLVPLVEAGVSREAIHDGIYVCSLFSAYTRLADALCWEVPPPGAVDASVNRLLGRGYV